VENSENLKSIAAGKIVTILLLYRPCHAF